MPDLWTEHVTPVIPMGFAIQVMQMILIVPVQLLRLVHDQTTILRTAPLFVTRQDDDLVYQVLLDHLAD